MGFSAWKVAKVCAGLLTVVSLTGSLLPVPPPAPSLPLDSCAGAAAEGATFTRISTADLLADAAAGVARLTHRGKTYEVPVEQVSVHGNFTDGVETKTWNEVIPIHYVGENKTTEVRALLVGTEDNLVVMFSSWHGMVLATAASSIASTSAGDCYLIGGAARAPHTGGELPGAHVPTMTPLEIPSTAPVQCIPLADRDEVCVPSCAGGVRQVESTVVFCGDEVEPCPGGISLSTNGGALVCGRPVQPCRRDPCVPMPECLEGNPQEDEPEICGYPIPECDLDASPGTPCGLHPCQGSICDNPCVEALGSIVENGQLAFISSEGEDDAPVLLDECVGGCPPASPECCSATDRALGNCCGDASDDCCDGELAPILSELRDLGLPGMCEGCEGPLVSVRALDDACQTGDPCGSGCDLFLHTYGDSRFCTTYHDDFYWAFMMGVGTAITQDVWDATGLNTRFYQNGDCGTWNPTTHTSTTPWLNSTTCPTVNDAAIDFEDTIMNDTTSTYYNDERNHLFFLYMAPTAPNFCGGGSFCPGNKGHADMRPLGDRGYGTTDPDLSDYDLHNRQAVDLTFVLAHELGHNLWGTHDGCTPGINPRNEDKPEFEPPVPQADRFAGADGCTELSSSPAVMFSEACYDIMGSRPTGPEWDDRDTIPRYSDGYHNENPSLSNKYYMQCEIAWKITGDDRYHTADGCAQMHGATTAFSPALP
ncbi:MAG: hypothetical protein QOD77_1273 [Thermoplasmata archaeon]|jgi:hypothetical protein|nr:hypothetical protein [Thermoplasmata archaeon]